MERFDSIFAYYEISALFVTVKIIRKPFKNLIIAKMAFSCSDMKLGQSLGSNTEEARKQLNSLINKTVPVT